MRNCARYFVSVVLLLTSALFTTSCSYSGSRNLREAEEYSRLGDSARSIDAYEAHIADRLKTETRPAWENPHFYRLIIGDVYLAHGDTVRALESYERAEHEKVDGVLVADRFRAVASWFEKKGELETAISLLQKYRDRDTLLFDAMLDRFAKQLTRNEALDSAQKPTLSPSESPSHDSSKTAETTPTS